MKPEHNRLVDTFHWLNYRNISGLIFFRITVFSLSWKLSFYRKCDACSKKIAFTVPLLVIQSLCQWVVRLTTDLYRLFFSKRIYPHNLCQGVPSM